MLIQADTSGGRDGINIVSMISSVAYLLELIDCILLLRTMGSNIIVFLHLSLEQQVEVLEDFVWDNRVEVNFTRRNNNIGRNGSFFNVAGYHIEERRRWPIINASPRRQCSK